MKSIKLVTLFLCGLLFLHLCSCVQNTPPPNNIYSNTYTTTSVRQYRPINSEAGITERDAVNTALTNNPGYRIKQLEAISAEADYYSSLTNLTPNVSISNNSGVTTTYQGNPSSIMNVLTAKAAADKAQYDTDNYRREMVKNINVTHSDMQKNKSIAAIQVEDEEFQREMANNISKKKSSTADILNFKINELNAKATAIEAEKNYKVNSYALAAKMGITSAELPASVNTQKSISTKSVKNNKNRLLDLNYYLDIAIENRPDLKTHKKALNAAKYDLYSAAGALIPTVTAAAGNSNSSVSTSKNINPGNRIAGIRSKDANYAIQQEDLKEKWISAIKEVKEAYLKLTSQLAVRKTLESTIHMAEQRRDLIANQYSSNTGKTKDIATLTQAQKNLVDAQTSFIKAEKNISDAKAELCAACGIPNDRTKKPGITTLNQVQYDYVDAEKNYTDSQIEVLKAGASLDAAAEIQH